MTAPAVRRPATTSPSAPPGARGGGPSRPAGRGGGGGDQLPLHAAAVVAVLAATAGVHPVLAGSSWWWPVVGVSVLVGAVGAVAHRLPGAAVVAVQVLAALLLVTVLYAPVQAVLGVLPGPAAWTQLHLLWRSAWRDIAEQTAPAPASAGLRLLTTATAAALAVVVDAVATWGRRPALAGLPLLGVHVLLAVLAPDGLPVTSFALAGAGYAVLLVVGAASRTSAWGRSVRPGGAGGAGRSWTERARGSGPAVAAVVAVVAVAALVPALLPGTRDGFGLVAGSGLQGAGAVDPLIDLRSDLHSRSTAPVLRYSTTVEDPQPLRIVTIDVFDGSVWRPSLDRASTRRLTGPLPSPPGLEAGVRAPREREKISDVGLRQQWLPLPYPATSVDVDGDWIYDARTLNVAGTNGTLTRPGQSYSVTYREVAPTAAQLQSAAAPPKAVLDAYAALPPGLPASIGATARRVVGSASTEYARAVALQDWFRESGGFTYSTRAPQPRSASALADFLRDKRGYCVHFASAMAVMARSLGIPARVAVGFLPGDQSSGGTWTVSLQDAHAWPELYFSGVGWVRFEPTPAERTGAAPGWTSPATSSSTSSSAAPSAAAPSSGPSASAAAPSAAPRDQQLPAGVASSEPSGWPWRRTLLAVVLALGAASLPLAARGLVRRRRRSAARRTGLAAKAAWEDLVDRLGDLGVSLPPAATPRQVGERLRTSGHAPEPAVGRLVGALEHERYAAPGAAAPTSGGLGVLERDVDAVVAAVAAGRPRRTAWRARWAPASGLRALVIGDRRGERR